MPADKIWKYRADYNNRPPSAVSFMPAIGSTSGRLHSEFVRLLFLQAHRETDRFFAVSGVQSAQSTICQFHFRRAAFSAQLKSTVGLALAKAAALRINLNLDGVTIASKSHTHPSHSQTSRLLTSSLSLGVVNQPSLQAHVSATSVGTHSPSQLCCTNWLVVELERSWLGECVPTDVALTCVCQVRYRRQRHGCWGSMGCNTSAVLAKSTNGGDREEWSVCETT
jgi:hypothetical protein